MDVREFLFEVVAWLISVGITLGVFCLFLWVLAWLIDKGEWK